MLVNSLVISNKRWKLKTLETVCRPLGLFANEEEHQAYKEQIEEHRQCMK